MIVDGSYMAWVRPTRQVRLALSAGMTLTGVILIAAGAFGGHGAVRPAPLIGRTADSVVGDGSGGSGVNGMSGVPGGLVPAAPVVHFAPPVTVTPKPEAKPDGKPTTRPDAKPNAEDATPDAKDGKPHPGPKPHPKHAVHPSDVSPPLSPPAPHALPHPAAPMPPASPMSLPAHPVKH